MAKTKVSEFDATASNNTDINSVNVAEGCPPSGINNAIREMASLLKKQEVGTDAMTSPDIDGGTIDGATIGGSSGVTIGVSDGTVSAPSIKFTSDTNTGIYRGGTDILKFVTAGTDAITIDASQDVTLAGSLTFADNEKAIFGAGSDLQIYHDGTNSIVADVGTGNLQLRGTNIQFMNGTGSQTMAFMFESDTVQLRHNNVTKLATTSSGIDVTGTVTADGLTVESALVYEPTVRIKNTNPDAISAYLVMQKDSASPAVNDVLGTMLFQGDDNAANTTNYGLIEGISSNVTDGAEQGTINIKTAGGGGSLKTRITADGNGDISFYEDTGTTPKFFWDASEERLGIGTSSPSTTLHLDSGGTPTTIQIDSDTEASIDFNDHGGSAKRYKIGTNISSNDGQLEFKDMTANAERMRITSAGNVGIGNTNPEAFGSLVDNLVVGTTSGDNGITIASGTGNGGRIQFADNTSSPFRGAFEYDHSSDAMIFYTNGSGRMRIDSSGKLLVGTTSGDSNAVGAGYQVQYLAAGTTVNIGHPSSAGDGYSYMLFSYNNGVIGSIGQSGTTGVAYNTSSDHRLKENVTADWDATTRLKQLNPVRFNFIADADTTVDGFLAHEVQSVVPEAITGTHNEVDDNGNPVYQGIDQSKLVPLLVKTIQELEARIVALETA
jgi:hypothetical protein